MNTRSLRSRLKPHLWFQAYWVVYLVWFFWLDLTITDPKYIIHSPIDDFIPFNEWFVFLYCSWFCCWRRSQRCSGGTTRKATTSSA